MAVFRAEKDTGEWNGIAAAEVTMAVVVMVMVVGDSPIQRVMVRSNK